MCVGGDVSSLVRGERPSGLPRWLEVPVCLLALFVLSPVLILTAVVVKLSSPGPVLFTQERMGKAMRHFKLFKFRSMRVQTVGPQVTAQGDSRVTAVGRILRATKLDELPGLWNVVRGDMSLVGPRPEVPAYVQEDSIAWQEVLRVRPGITDPVTLRLRNEEELVAQAVGDHEAFYLEILQPYKLAGYLEYLRRRTWWTDVGVLWASVWAVLRPGTAPPPTMGEVRAAAESLPPRPGDKVPTGGVVSGQECLACLQGMPTEETGKGGLA